MDWSAFFGASVGAIVTIFVLIGGIIGWDEISRRREARKIPEKSPTVDDILESQIEEHILANFSALFPGWTVYDDQDEIAERGKPAGAYLHTDAGQIDILCLDSKENFVVVELKRNKAPDKVIAQVDRYIAWVEKNLAEPGQDVGGLIIANSLDKRLAYALSRRPNIDFWSYSWSMEFDKNAVERILQVDSEMS